MEQHVSDTITRHRKAQEREAKCADINKATIFAALKEAGITRMTAEFDGEGDSGQLEEFVFEGPNYKQKALSAGTVPYQHYDRYKEQEVTLPLDFHESAERLCYELLSLKYGGWENNDGAFGTFTFDVTTEKVDLEFNQRFCDYSTQNTVF